MSYLKLQELAASLVDDVGAVIASLEAADTPFCEMKKRLAQQSEKFVEFGAQAQEHLTKVDVLALDVADLKARLKHADTRLRVEKGYAMSFNYKKAQVERTIREINDRILVRREYLLRREIEKRVNSIGKKIVRNSGRRRSGGGFDLIPDDGLLPGGYKNPNSLINQDGPQQQPE